MKNLIILIIGLLSIQKVFPQKLDYSEYDGKFDYCLIEKNCVYIPLRPKEIDRAHIIQKNCMTPESNTYIHYGSGPGPFSIKFPFAWTKVEETTFGVSSFISTNGQSINNYIQYREFEKKDSLELISTASSDDRLLVKNIWITPLGDYERSFLSMQKPLNSRELIKMMHNNLSFDIYASNPDLIQIYLRDTTTLYVWQCNLPSYKAKQWQEVAVYTSPKTDFEYPPFKYSDSYSGTKTHINAITDSLFFDGHFKIIKQDGHDFIINREHALIYHMGEKAINRIGKVDIKGDYPALRGKKLFIEDRDNNEIIFFAPVTWEENDLPKPRIKVMNEAEMKEKFKYVME